MIIFKIKIKDFEKGISLVEIVVAIFIIALFSVIVVANFPKIKKQFALSRAVYRVAQDIRKAEDLGLSGIQTIEGVEAKGYGFFIDQLVDNKKYLIYADTNDPADSKYTNYLDFPDDYDYIIEEINLADMEQGVFIERMFVIFSNELGLEVEKDIYYLSINFSPPNPDITITTDAKNPFFGEGVLSIIKKVGIVLSLDTDLYSKKTIYINSSGLIEIE